MAKSEDNEAADLDTNAVEAAPRSKSSGGGKRRGGNGQWSPRNTLLVRDFLVPCLDNGFYGDDLQWLNRSRGIFLIRWTHQGSKSFNREGRNVFRDWSVMKRKWDDQDPNRLSKAKQRVRAAFRKLPNVRRINEDASDEPLLDEPATPDGFATSDEVAASWTALRDAGVVPDSESFCDYVSADSEVVATEQLLDDDIVRAVNDPDETSDDDSADERADSVPKASNVPTASEALDAVDVLRRYYGAHEGGEDGMNIAAAAERAIVRIRKMQQRPITDFFAATAV
ncbi:hypothetical protein HPB52_005202 [Rhipicephalus sanguineus]|uniref:IRF tryptophan pentad repeat domain-containing protein n=1 Tax=Rhipicephalus sanguineus TaxID=34632 RepID=A0A9D4QDR5_RHISA|nr:hypothetical protein HPB52_005202 [Rhipicephalus sanguineus]